MVGLDLLGRGYFISSQVDLIVDTAAEAFVGWDGACREFHPHGSAPLKALHITRSSVVEMECPLLSVFLPARDHYSQVNYIPVFDFAGQLVGICRMPIYIYFEKCL